MCSKPPIPARARIALLFGLLCAGCAPQAIQQVPQALTELPSRPLPPADPTDRDIALLIVAQDEVLQACYSQMGRIRTLVEPAGAGR